MSFCRAAITLGRNRPDWLLKGILPNSPFFIKARFDLLLLVAFFLAVPAVLQGKSYDIADYDVEVKVRADGIYEVTETIHFRFQSGTFRYGYRKIPSDRIDTVRDVTVSDIDGEITQVDRVKKSGAYWIQWFFKGRTEPTRFRLNYVVEGALFESGGKNRVDWNAIANQWKVAIYDVDVRVELPPAFELRRGDIACRPDGARLLQRQDGGWAASFHRDQVSPGSVYEVVVSFPKNVVGRMEGMGGWLLGGKIVMAILLGGIGLFPGLMAYRHWRSPSYGTDIGRAAVFQLEGVSMAHAGMLLTELRKGGARGISATIFDLGKRGGVSLTRKKAPNGYFVRVETDPSCKLTNGFERQLMKLLGSIDYLNEIVLYPKTMREALKEVRQELVDEGYLCDKSMRSNVMLATAVAGIMMAVFLVDPHFLAQPMLGALCGGVGGGALLASRVRYPLSMSGAELHGKITGYLTKVREDIDDALLGRPAEAAALFAKELPWLSLDLKVDTKYVKRIEEGLRGNEASVFEYPKWAVSDDSDGEIKDAKAVFHAFGDIFYMTSFSVGSGVGAGGGGGGAG